MQRQVVHSSALSSAGYDVNSKILELEFRESGGIWQYFGFSKRSFTKFMNAESLGSFFVTRIKGKYPELRIKKEYLIACAALLIITSGIVFGCRFNSAFTKTIG